MATQTTIEMVLVKLGGVFPGSKIGADGIETYGEMLGDIPDVVLINAMRECLLTCRFFPTIAEIRAKAEPFLEKLRIEEIKKPDIETCKKNVTRSNMHPNIVCCFLENDNKCFFANSGVCRKWDTEVLNTKPIKIIKLEKGVM